MVLFGVVLGFFQLRMVISGWMGGRKCWHALSLMTGRNDKVDSPKFYF